MRLVGRDGIRILLLSVLSENYDDYSFFGDAWGAEGRPADSSAKNVLKE